MLDNKEFCKFMNKTDGDYMQVVVSGEENKQASELLGHLSITDRDNEDISKHVHLGIIPIEETHTNVNGAPRKRVMLHNTAYEDVAVIDKLTYLPSIQTVYLIRTQQYTFRRFGTSMRAIINSFNTYYTKQVIQKILDTEAFIHKFNNASSKETKVLLAKISPIDLRAEDYQEASALLCGCTKLDTGKASNEGIDYKVIHWTKEKRQATIYNYKYIPNGDTIYMIAYGIWRYLSTDISKAIKHYNENYDLPINRTR